jgi:hypothetical protein
MLPLKCVCGLENMVDIANMETRPVSSLTKAEGFTCSCGKWNDVFFVTLSLAEQMQRLGGMTVTHRKFQYYFAKTLRKAAGIQRKQIG